MATRNTFLSSPFDNLLPQDAANASTLPGQQPTQQMRLPPLEQVQTPQAQAPQGQQAPQAEAPQAQPQQPADARQPTRRANDLLPPPNFRPIFEAAAREFDVPVNVLMALGHQESRFNPQAIGPETQWGRARGMMQYLDSTAQNLGINPFMPEQAIPAAARQIRERLDKGYSMEDAIKEHFAGPNRKLWGPKTAAYGREVLDKTGQIAALLGQEQPQQSDAGGGRGNVNPPMALDPNQPIYPSEQPRPEQAGLPQTEAPEASQQERLGFVDTTALLGRQLWDAAVYHLPASVAAAIEGDDPFAERDWKDRLIDRSRNRTREGMGEGDENTPTFIPGVSAQDVKALGPSLGFSVTGMGAGLGVGVPAAAAGTLVAPGVGTVGGLTAGGAASGVTAYRMATNAFVRDLREIADLDAQQKGRGPLTDAEFAEKMKEIQGAVHEHGLWEALPEAASNVIGFGVLKAPVKTAIGRVFGQNVLTRLGTKAAAVYGTELATETVTEQGQHNVMTGVAPMFGVNDMERRSWTSAADLGESFREIAPTTILQTTILAGGTKSAMMLHDRIKRGSLTPQQYDALMELNDLVERGQFDAESARQEAVRLLDPNNTQPQQQPDLSQPAGTDGIIIPPSGGRAAEDEELSKRSTAPGPLTRAAENAAEDVAPDQRVTVTAPEGQITGFVESYQADGQGGFVARILGDDGMVYNFTHQDGVQIDLEAPKPGPLTASVEAARPAQPEPVAAPVSGPLMDEGTKTPAEFADLFDEQGRPKFSNAQSIKDFKKRTGLGQDGVRAIQAAIQEGRQITLEQAMQADKDAQAKRAADLEQSKKDSEAEAEQAKANAAKPAEKREAVGEFEIPGLEGAINRVRVFRQGDKVEAVGLDEGTANNDLTRLVESGLSVEEALAQLYGDHAQGATPDASKVKRADGQPERADKPLTDMSEAELRARLKYIADQAKAAGGWNKMFIDARREVEREINTRAKPVEVEAPKAATVLPRELAGAKPRYSFGAKQFDLSFASDFDKAAYITSQATPSKRDADYLQFAMDAMGMSEAEVRAHGQKVRDAIKALAKDAEPGKLNVPQVPQVSTTTNEGVRNEPTATAETIPQQGQEAAQEVTAQQDQATPTARDEHAGKWFGSREKADAYLGKKKIGDTHEVVQTGKVRFEVMPKIEGAKQTKSDIITERRVTYEGKPATLQIIRMKDDPAKVAAVRIKVDGERLPAANLGGQGVLTDEQLIQSMTETEIINGDNDRANQQPASAEAVVQEANAGQATGTPVQPAPGQNEAQAEVSAQAEFDAALKNAREKLPEGFSIQLERDSLSLMQNGKFAVNGLGRNMAGLVEALRQAELRAGQAAAPDNRTADKARQKAQAKAQRDLHVVAATDQGILAMAGNMELADFTEAVNEKLAAEIARIADEYTGDEKAGVLALVQDGKPVLPREFYESAYREARKNWEESQKAAARDPQAYTDTIETGIGARGISGEKDIADYKAGFEHAAKGKTRSTLPQGGRHGDGYDDARAWFKTEDGKAWFEGKPRQAKQKSTGEALKRAQDRNRKSIDAIDGKDEKKSWEAFLKATQRSDLFPINLAEDATPGAKEWLSKFRDNIATFPEFYTRVMVASKHEARKRYGIKAEDVFTGRFSSYKGLIVERFAETREDGRTTNGLSYLATDEQRLELSKEVALSYQDKLTTLAAKFEGLKSLDDIKKVIEDTYGQPGDYKLGSIEAGDVALYYDNNSSIIGLFPTKPDAWDAKYSTWTRLTVTEEAERTQKARKDPLMRPRLDRIERKARDVRKGKSVTAAEFKKTFNFADVTIGEYVTAQEAEDHLNYAHDAFITLSDLLGIKPEQISFGGKLHFSIGALGHGKHAAHFAPNHPTASGGTVPVINVTKTRGDGTVLHEYFHAIDFLTTDPKLKAAIADLKRLLVQTPKSPDTVVPLVEGFLTGSRKLTNMGRGTTPQDHARYALKSYYRNKADKTQFYRDAEELDAGRGNDPYWSNNYEPWARASEAWGYDALNGNQERDDYLVSDWVADGKVTKKTHRGTPYPVGDERQRFGRLFSEFAKSMDWSDGAPKLKADHPWQQETPYAAQMKPWLAALDNALENLDGIEAAMKERKAAEEAQRQAEREEAERRALFGETPEPQNPTAMSEPEGDAKLSEDELAAIFDEEAASIREANQEQPQAKEPGAALDNMKWTKEDASELLALVNDGQIVLVTDPSLGLPTIHNMPSDATTHMGYGVFRTSTPTFEATWSAGGAMSHTASGKSYTTVNVTRGQMDPALYDKDKVAAKLRVLAGEGKNADEKRRTKLADKQGKGLADLTDEQQKTAAVLAKEFAKHGVKGMDKTLEGLTKLFGGGPGRLNSFPGGFDEQTYAEAKVLFKQAAEEFRSAGLSFKEFARVFFNALISQFGDGVKPYAIRFAKEYQETYEQVAPAEPQTQPEAQAAEDDATVKLSDWALQMLRDGKQIRWQDLFKQADVDFKGSQADGAYTPKDAYDAVELAVNRYLIEKGDINPAVGLAEAKKAISRAEDILDNVPTQSKRTAEMDEFQQFSTPPHFSYLANWAANLRPSDSYLEPSGGIGGLAVYGKIAGVRDVAVNELSARRLAVLRNLPFDRFFGENAEQLNNILPDDVQPTVIVMNPPFSATAGRIEGKRSTSVGAQHIEQALKRLQPGGRLVAIVGEGMAADRPAFTGWWNKIKQEYNVRANIGLEGESYSKYGTTFDTQILVIDKSGPTTGDIITASDLHPSEALELLEAVRNDRPEATQPDSQVAGGTRGQADAQDSGRAADTGTASPVVDTPMGGRGQRGTDGTGQRNDGSTGGDVTQQATSSPARPARPGRPANRDGARTDAGANAQGNRANDSVSSEPSNSEVTVERADNADRGEITNSVFETYTPKKVRIPGAVPHNTPLVESSAMAAVVPPDPTYTPNLPKDVITKGLLSSAQLESVVYAGQAHSQMLRDGETRRGFFLGDGTGVGKGRQISGVILDNMRQGRNKAVWLSKKKELMEDAKRDFGDLGGDANLIFNQAKTKPGEKITAKEGILFAGYPGLRSQSRAAQQASKAAGGNRQKGADGITYERVRQIVDWVGADFDGVIVFDEAHEMGNAVPVKGKRGMTKPSDQALAGLELQKALPKARIMYVSATGATEVQNLAYAPRLGLWGEGTPFSTVIEFVNSLSKSVSAMELVAQNLKQMGLYLARSLSFDGVTYTRLEHQLSPYQRDTYDLLAEAWQNVLNNIGAALEDTGVMSEGKGSGRNSGKIKSAVLSAFWGSHQRFFNQIITAAQMPSILEQIEKDLAENKSVVLQLTNTNEADQERALAKAADKAKADDSDADALEELDLTPREQLVQFVEKSFPVIQYESYMDENGVTQLRPVLDSEGNAVVSKDAVARRNELVTAIRAIRIPDSPLQMILDQFGTDTVAEITGRSQRVIKDENGKFKVEKRGAAAVASDSQAFKDGKKRILVFSQAGGTGFSFHADKRFKNRQQRSHYIVQAGWSADKAVQGFGRSHRTNQESAPIYRLAMTDVPAHKRFVSSIARRLEQLGALTAGQRDTAGGSIFSASDNLESPYATKAVRQFFEMAVNPTAAKTVELPADLLKQMGLEGAREEETGGLNDSKIPTTTQFLNRLLSLRLDTQEKVFGAFMDMIEQQIEIARRLGNFDDGLQTIKHVGAEVVQENEVYRDPDTKSEVKYVEVKYKTPNTFYDFDAANNVMKGGKKGYGWFRNKQSGRVAGVWETNQMTTLKDGSIEGVYGLWRTSGNSYEAKSKFKPDTFERIKEDEARSLWEQENEQRPETKENTLHMVVGGILPLWDRFNDERVSVVRIGLDDGRRLLGRQIYEKDLGDTLNKLNVESSAAKMKGDDILKDVKTGKIVTLSNGWSLKKSRVSNDTRVEIDLGGKYLDYGKTAKLRQAGVITERIQWVDRYFVPTDKGAVLDEVMRVFGANAVSSADTSDVSFRRSTGKSAGMDRAQAQAIVNTITARWANAPAVAVVQSMQDPMVPEAVRRADERQRSQGAKGEPEGFWYGGTAYVVADAVATPTEVMRTVFHEVLGHYGLRGAFGDSLKPILSQIVKARRQDVAAKAKKYGLDMNKPEQALEAAEEVLADMAQTKPELGFVNRAIAAIRDWFRKHVPGFADMKLTDADIIQGYILPARRFVESGRAAGIVATTAFSRAAPVDSPAFKNWFGKSKVVDKQGKPLVVYHGTNAEFSEFDMSPGAFFSDSKSIAKEYAERRNGIRIEPVYLSMQKPFIVEAAGDMWDDVNIGGMGYDQATLKKIFGALSSTYTTEQIVQAVKASGLGFDGVIFRAVKDAPIGRARKSDVFAIFDATQAKSATGNNGNFDPTNPDIRFSREQVDELIKEARDELLGYDGPLAKDDYIGRVVSDLSIQSKYFNTPRTIAAFHPEFTPVFMTALSQVETRDSIVADLGKDMAAYEALPQTSKVNVNRVLELGRLTSSVYTAKQLADGVTNTGERTVVVVDDNGKPRKSTVPITALMSEPGEVLTLSKDEIEAYQGLRTSFDRSLDMMRDQTLEELGFAELKGKPNATKAILDRITDDTPEATANTLKGIAKFVAEIEQAKRAGYVPFSRYGDYVVTVKEKVADLEYTPDGDYRLVVSNVPSSMVEDLLMLGAEQTPAGDWTIRTEQKQAVEKLTEQTVYSAKVETGLRDLLPTRKARRAGDKGDLSKAGIENIPAVREALEKAEREWVAGNPARRIVAFETHPKKQDEPVRLSDVDSLAEIAGIDNRTWDAVREKLADAIKSRSFRKHFFHADNVPGYTADFERSMADYVIGMGGYLSRRQHVKRWDGAIGGITNKPNLHEYATDYRKYVNDPQEEFAMLRQIGFFAYIAGVIATAGVNLTQVPVATIPTMMQVAPTALVVKELGKAYVDAVKMMGRPSRVGLSMFDPDKAPADVRGALSEAWNEGAFVPLESLDLMMTARQRNVGARKGVKAFNKTVQVTAIAFTYAERLNRLVTFIAAARLQAKPAVREKAHRALAGNALASQSALGKNWNQKNFAEWMVDETQYRLGKANRAKLARSVGAPITQFKSSFMLNYYEMLYRMAKLHGNDGKLAFLASTAVVVSLAGVWGFPGGDDLRKLIEKAYREYTDKDLDLKNELRQWVAETSGSVALSQMVNKGMSYPVGVDMTRAGLGNAVPDSLTSALGIPYDLTVGRPSRAIRRAASEDYTGAVAELAPNFIKNPMLAASMKADGVRDRRGQRIMTPDEFTPGDIIMRSIGFQPSKVTDVRDYEYAQRRRETAVDALKRSYLNKMARTIAAMEVTIDPAEMARLEARLDSIYQEIDAHNAKASEEEFIQIGRDALRNRVGREMEGVRSTWGRERKNARGTAEDMRRLYNLEEGQ